MILVDFDMGSKRLVQGSEGHSCGNRQPISQVSDKEQESHPCLRTITSFVSVNLPSPEIYLYLFSLVDVDMIIDSLSCKPGGQESHRDRFWWVYRHTIAF